MLRIRLQRVGRKHDPSYRLVLTDRKNAPQSGKFLELLGSYDARVNKSEIKADRVKHWINVGAQTSDTVNNLLIKTKIIEGKTRNVLPKKTPIVKEVVEEEKKATAPAEEAKPTEETPAAEARLNDEVGQAPAEGTAETPAEAAPAETEKPAEETPAPEEPAPVAEEAKEEEKPAEATEEAK